MILVHAYFNSKESDVPGSFVAGIKQACRHIVPAGLSSPSGPCSPGRVRFLSSVVYDGDRESATVLLEVSAYGTGDWTDCGVRADKIRQGLKVCYPYCSFEVYLRLDLGGASTTRVHDDPPADMSMVAAIQRFRAELERGWDG